MLDALTGTSVSGIRDIYVKFGPRGSDEAKFWLDPVRVAWNTGFGRVEITRVEVLVRKNAVFLRRAWDEYFTH